MLFVNDAMQTPRALDAGSDAYINSEGLIPVGTPCRILVAQCERRDRGTEVSGRNAIC